MSGAAEVQVKERPILFSGPMVRAILEGRKSQTRRIVKHRITGPNPPNASIYDCYEGKRWVGAMNLKGEGNFVARCPYGKPGDRLWVTQGAINERDQSFEDRFWGRVYKTAGCWEWFGHTNRKRYGTIRRDGVELATHRASWLIHNGDIPTGLHVLHTCDLPWCVRPDHLYLGTNEDNIRDKVSRGRTARVIGENNGGSRLTAEQVEEIRVLYWEQDIYQKDIAQQFGITQPQVSKIINNKRWLAETSIPEVIGSRTLKITKVKVERLQEISEEDAKAEGMQFNKEAEPNGWYFDWSTIRPSKSFPALSDYGLASARLAFGNLWNSINSKRNASKYDWAKNPWVWVIEFRKVQQ